MRYVPRDHEQMTADAWCRPAENYMCIPDRYPPTRQLELMLHEALHFMCMRHDLEDEKEELVCSLGGEFLALLLLNNPALLDFVKNISRVEA